MKKLIGVIFSLMCASMLFAQQQPLYTQYMLNDFAINPAVAGSKGHWTSLLTYRHQWLGFEGAPITQTLTVHGTFKGERNGFGAMLFNDIVGPTRKTGINLGYTYILPLGDDAKLGIGMQGGIFQFTIDGTKILTTQPGDLAIPQGSDNVIVPDAAFGFYLNSKKYFAGISAPHLIESQIKLSDVNRVRISRLSRHYFLLGGYRYEVNRDMTVEPSIFVKYVAGAPLQLDLNVKVIMEELYWFGASYRSLAAISIMGGVTLQKRWNIGYAYDMTTTAIRNFNNGSHEIVIGYNFIK